jgi:hypothetical protein
LGEPSNKSIFFRDAESRKHEAIILINVVQLAKDEVSKEVLHNEEVRDFYRSFCFVMVVKYEPV